MTLPWCCWFWFDHFWDVSKTLTSSSIWELVNLHFSTNYTYFSVWVRYFVWTFKVYLWNYTHTKNILPIHWEIWFIWKVENLTHWGRVTHICVSKLTIVGSDNGLSPGRCQAIIWINAGILLIGPLGTNFSETLIEIYILSWRKCIWNCRQEIGGHFVLASMC